MEIVLRTPVFPGDSDVAQLNKIFTLLGTPTPETWPNVEYLPNYVHYEPKKSVFPVMPSSTASSSSAGSSSDGDGATTTTTTTPTPTPNTNNPSNTTVNVNTLNTFLRDYYSNGTELGKLFHHYAPAMNIYILVSLILGCLQLNPLKRITAFKALKHKYFHVNTPPLMTLPHLLKLPFVPNANSNTTSIASNSSNSSNGVVKMEVEVVESKSNNSNSNSKNNTLTLNSTTSNATNSISINDKNDVIVKKQRIE